MIDPSILLARVLGIALVVVYSSVFLNSSFFRRSLVEFTQQPSLLLMAGFIPLVLGLLVIQFHNIWTWDWRVIITLLGWLMLFQGIFRILFPDTVLRLARWIIDNKRYTLINIISAVLLIIGLYLTYIGFQF